MATKLLQLLIQTGDVSDKFLPNLLPKAQYGYSGKPTLRQIMQMPDKRYSPSPAVMDTKAGLAAASMVTGPFSFIPGTASAVYDLGTSARYAMDGQWDNAKESLISAGLNAIPTAGVYGALTAMGKLQKAARARAAIRSAKGAMNAKDIAGSSTIRNNITGLVQEFDKAGKEISSMRPRSAAEVKYHNQNIQNQYRTGYTPEGPSEYMPFMSPKYTYGGQPCYECGGMYADGGYYDCPDQEKDPVTGKCAADVARGKEANAANKAATKDMNAWAKQVAAIDKEVAKQNAAQNAGQLSFDYDWMQSQLDKAEKKAAVAQYKQFFQQNPNVFVADDTSGYSPEQKYVVASKLKQRISTPMGSKLFQQQYGVDPRYYDLQRLQSEVAPKMGGWNGMRNWLFNVYKEDGGPIVDPMGQWAYPGQVTRIPGSNITMQGVPYPVYGVGSNGQEQMMQPGQEYNFGGASYVDEYPMMKNGGGLLSKTVSCSNCGWSWKAVDGGYDPLTCHKCGGIVKMQKGGIKVKDSFSDTRALRQAGMLPPLTNKASSERKFLTDWNNSAMGKQMLYDSVDKDNPSGINFLYSDKIIDDRNALINQASVNISNQEDFSKKAKIAFSDRKDVSDIAGYASERNRLQAKRDKTRLTDWNAILSFPSNKYNFISSFRPDNNYEIHMHDEIELDAPNQTLVHELGHASDAAGKLLPDSDIQKIKRYAYGTDGKRELNSFQRYVAEPTETRARLLNFRYNAKNQQLYNPFTQKVTPEVLKKYKDIVSSGYDPLEQLREVYNDKQIIDMLNSISKKQNNKIFNAKNGGQHGGLDRWFAEKWVDVKTGKACGRQEGESRPGYPACRPSKRINSQTPKTSSEMSPAEKARFKSSKTSSQRIDYNHKRNK